MGREELGNTPVERPADPECVPDGRRPRRIRHQDKPDKKQVSSPGRRDARGATILSVKTFKIIANTTMQFSEYLQLTHGQDEDLIAREDKVRAATFDSPPVYTRRSKIQALESCASTSNSSTSSGSESETDAASSSEGDTASRTSSGDSVSEDDRKRHGKGKRKGNKKGKSSSKGQENSRREKRGR